MDVREANASWEVQRCPSCHGYWANLISAATIQRHEEITVPTNPSPEWEDVAWPYEATFDGGAREIGSGCVAGAGAAIWQHHLQGGAPTRVASAVVAIPWDASAQVAEAVGCRTALGLLLDLPTEQRCARMVGDNIAVVRYGAGHARLRRIDMQGHLEHSLQEAYRRGWTFHWQAVRRRLNGSADDLATQGVYWAAQLRDRGDTAIRTEVTWHVTPPSATAQ